MQLTEQQLSTLINKAAACAAAASLDAHKALVPAADAWQFLQDVCASEEGESAYDFMNQLPEAMPVQFAHDYRRLGAALQAGNPFAWELATSKDGAK